MMDDVFEVRLVVRDGELADVQPIGRSSEFKRYEISFEKNQKLTDLPKIHNVNLNVYSGTVLMVGHGSPGYIIYKTKYGYIVIKNPNQ